MRRKNVDATDPATRKANDLLRQGFSYRLVMSKTGLSYHQVHYQTRRFECRPRDYRSGISNQAQAAIARIDRAMGVIREIRKLSKRRSA